MLLNIIYNCICVPDVASVCFNLNNKIKVFANSTQIRFQILKNSRKKENNHVLDNNKRFRK